jgi:hypothetical protein
VIDNSDRIYLLDLQEGFIQHEAGDKPIADLKPEDLEIKNLTDLDALL